MATNDEKTQFVGTARRGEDVVPTQIANAPDRSKPLAAPSRWPERDLVRDGRSRGDTETEALQRGKLPQPKVTAAGTPLADDDERTQLVRSSPTPSAASQPQPAGSERAAAGTASDAADDDASSQDPVVGWLVVVEGPGRGRSLEIGFGANALGRDPAQKLALTWGDQGVSRERHALVVFDPRTARFFLQAGDGRNLTYIDDALVMAPVEMKGGETILVGATKLRFQPLCGPKFSWT